MLIIIRFFIFLIVFIFSFSFDCSAVSELSLSADSAIIIDAENNSILYQKNARKIRSMASTTKIMTALIAIESGKLNEQIKINKPPVIEGTAIGFKAGDTVTLELLCYGMLLESGNDSALVAAEYLAGSEYEFSKLMNSKAAEIGMNDTNFVTASGLDDDNHYTTAYDMALLGAYATQNNKFVEICSSKTYNAEFKNPDRIRTFSNHNRLLSSCDGVFGIKTGFTKKSGRCLVTACRRNGKTLVAVTLNAPDDWNDHKKLYDYAYSFYNEISPELNIKKEVLLYGAAEDKLTIQYEIDSFSVKCDDTITYKIFLPKNVYAPVRIGDVIGEICFYTDNIIIRKFPIVSKENISVYADAKIYKPGFWGYIKDFANKLFNY